MRKTILLRLALLLALACLLLAPALEARAADNLAVLFPDSSKLGRHKFALAPVQVAVGKPLPAELGFSLIIPAGNWCQVAPDLTLKHAQRLGGFVSPRGKKFGMIEVLSHQLQAEVSAADWLVAMLGRSQVTVLKTRSVLSAGGPAFEALGVLQLPKDSTEPPTLVRAMVLRSGQRLFVVRCLARQDAFADLVFQFASATLLFKPVQNEQPMLVGNWSLQCLKNGVCFTGPAWGLAQVPWPGRQVQEAGFDLKQGELVTGALHVKAINGPELAGTACEQRISVLSRDLTARGVDIDWTTGGIAVAHPNLGDGGCYYRGRGFKGSEDLELYVFSWSSERMAIVVWMLSVGQISNLPAWMQNKRAFEIMCRGLKITGG